MSWIYFAIANIILFTGVNLLQRVISIDSKYPKAMSVVFNVYAGIAALIIFLITGSFKDFQAPTTILPWVLIGISCLCYGIFEKMRFKVSQLLDASVNSTINTTSAVVTFVISVVVLQEELTLAKFIGFLLIIISLILVSYRKHMQGTLKGILIGIFAYSLLGTGWAVDKVGLGYFNISTYNILIWTIPIIIVYLPYVKTEELIVEAKIGSWKLFVLAFLNVIGYVLQIKALTLGEASIVIPFLQISLLATVIMGIVVLKEREFILRKLVAGTLALVGMAILLM